MVSSVIQNLFASTYKDDYTDSAGYHRILFNSGRALQARELTQMQTIIQGEISRFGRNVFKEGASVNPGGPTINDQYDFVKLNTGTYSLPTDPTTLVGAIYTGGSSNLRIKVLEVAEAVGSDPATLYVQYLGDGSSGAATQNRLTPGETITASGFDTLVAQTTNTTENPAVGQGVKFSVAGGDFFVFGHFVFVPPQSIMLNKYANKFTGTIGFVAQESVVTANDVADLYDNQNASPNFSAPGADRYKITLTLIDKANALDTQMFVYYADVRESVILSHATGTDQYNKISDIMALRTFEESGDYVVRPFRLKFDLDSDTNYLRADVSNGTAYVQGRRLHNPAPTSLRINKPNTTTTLANEVVAADYGNYVYVDNLIGQPDVNTLSAVNLKSAITAGGTTLGTARVRAIEEDALGYKLYLMNIVMNGANSFRSVKSVGTSSINYGNLILNGLNEAELYDAGNNDLLFPLPNARPQTITDISLQVQKRFGVTADGSGNAVLGSGLLSAGQTWSNTSNWIVTDNATGANLSGVVSISGSGTTTSSITGAGAGYASATFNVTTYVNISAGSARAKTLTERTIATAVESDGSGLKWVDLGRSDVIDVSKITQTDSNGADLAGSFRFDNGQRDNYYDNGRLIVKGGRSAPAGNVFARYTYFAHGAGDFFSVNSYSVPYADIPSHTLANGAIVELRDVLDFRPVTNYAQTNFSGNGAIVNLLPAPTDLINADITYYLPRNDKLVIGETGAIELIPGVASLTPQFPETPSNSIELYKVFLNANTINNEDLSTRMVDNKRFTMRDIAKLEKRVDRLEEYATLSLLELDTSSVAVYDSAGLARTKAGFLADNFNDHFYSDTRAADYRASIDPIAKVVRPSIWQDNIRLIYDSNLSSGVILKGDNIFLDYTETTMITQSMVSQTENVNPFAVVTNVGIVQFSPETDDWKVTQYMAPKMVDGGIRLDADQARLFNSWQWDWQGLAAGSDDLTGTTLGSNSFFTGGGRRRSQTVTVDRVVSDEVVNEVIGDRVVSIALIPWMRSRKIYLKAHGLTPYTRYWPFFDGTSVDSWCRLEAYKKISTDPEDVGQRYLTATGHPEGSSQLISDANGNIEGSFFIPSRTDLRFRTGTRQFVLNNVSSINSDDGTSTANGLFTASGVLETRQETIKSTRIITVRGTRSTTRVGKAKDPLAQSFTVDTPEGVFVTKVDVYFKTKPNVAAGDNPSPVALEIRPLVNGQPSSDTVVPGSTKVLLPEEVTLVTTQTRAGVLAAPTSFEFDEPIYLNGNTDYCIVVLADTTAYNLYVAETEAYVLGTTQKRVTRQPSMGSLFKSQNGATWEPDQTKDMTYKIHKAQFATVGGFATLENAKMPLYLLPEDPLTIDAASRWVTVSHPNHGMDSGDAVKIYGLDSASTYGGITGANLMGSRTVSFPDYTGYQVYAGSVGTSSVFAGGNQVLASQNMMFDIVNPSIDTLVVDNTSVSLQGKFMSGRSFAGQETRFVKDTSYRDLALKENDFGQAPRMIGNADIETSNGYKSSTIRINMSSISPNVSPVIDLQRASLVTASNIIDKQDSDNSVVGFNTPLVYSPETSASDGSHIAKHITVPVALAETAVGLTIILGANRASEADFLVYYRVGSEGENLGTKSWTRVVEQVSMPADANPNIFREYRYLVGGEGGTMLPFTEYQLKIVFRTTNSSKVPAIKDLRVIALAV